MIETAWMLVRLLAGLGSIEAAGYALLILVLRRRSGFKPLERLSLAFGLGSLGLTIWMLLLSFAQVPYSLATIAVPWLALAALGVWPAWKRGWLREDCRAVLAVGQSLLTRGAAGIFPGWKKSCCCCYCWLLGSVSCGRRCTRSGPGTPCRPGA